MTRSNVDLFPKYTVNIQYLSKNFESLDTVLNYFNRHIINTNFLETAL